MAECFWTDYIKTVEECGGEPPSDCISLCDIGYDDYLESKATAFQSLNEHTTYDADSPGNWVAPPTEEIYVESTASICTLTDDFYMYVQVVSAPIDTSYIRAETLDQYGVVLDSLDREVVFGGRSYLQTVPAGFSGKIRVRIYVVSGSVHYLRFRGFSPSTDHGDQCGEGGGEGGGEEGGGGGGDLPMP